MKKNILIMSQTFPLNKRDHTAHFMLDFSTGFAELGHNVIVLLPFHPNLTINYLVPNLKVVSFKYIYPTKFHKLGFGKTLVNDQKIKWFVYLLFPFYFLSAVVNLYQLTRKEKIDLISAHWVLPNGLISALVSRLTGIPLIITLPGSDVYLARRNIFFNFATKYAIKSATKVISNSPQLLKDLNIKDGKVISYPVLPNKVQRAKKNSKIIIATAGRSVEKKGFEILKKTIPKIEIITDLPINKFRQKLLEVDIFIAYSIRDSTGNLDDASVVVLEAMAAGCVVITSNLPGYKKIIKNHQFGFVINDLAELTAIVDILKKNPALRTKIGRAARKNINNNFSPKFIAKQYLKL